MAEVSYFGISFPLWLVDPPRHRHGWRRTGRFYPPARTMTIGAHIAAIGRSPELDSRTWAKMPLSAESSVAHHDTAKTVQYMAGFAHNSGSLGGRIKT